MTSPARRGWPFDPDRMFFIAGPCAIESRELCLTVADHLAATADSLGVDIIFKASFDKANRTSVDSFRGPGLDEGLRILEEVREASGLKLVSDIHTPDQAEPVGGVLDIIQIPAFLCRQTDLLVAAGATGKTINIKKGQFVAPGDMARAVAKVRAGGSDRVMLTERGSAFGYHNLVVDFRSLVTMAELGCPVVFDATHSVQLPGGLGGSSGGDRRFVEPLARAAAAVGVSGVFMEVHPDPDRALCDGPNSLPLDQVAALMARLLAINETAAISAT